MSVLSTALYTVNSEAEAEQFVGMAHGMTAAYQAQPGFERLVVARDVLNPLTIVTLSWSDPKKRCSRGPRARTTAQPRTTREDRGSKRRSSRPLESTEVGD